jgi:hypothetical protein
MRLAEKLDWKGLKTDVFKLKRYVLKEGIKDVTLKPGQLLHHKRYMAFVKPCNGLSTWAVSFKFWYFPVDTE